MHYLLNDTQQVELYAKALNLPTRTDPKLTDNQYYKAEPLIADVAKALAVGRTPYYPDLLRADQRSGRSLAAAAPEGVLHDRRSRHGHHRCQDSHEGDLLQVSPLGVVEPDAEGRGASTGAPRPIPSFTIACATGRPAGRAQPWRPNDRQTTSKTDRTAVRGAGRHLRAGLHGHPAGRDGRRCRSPTGRSSRHRSSSD